MCGNAANTANCDLDVSPDTNLIQNGADAVALLVGDAVNFPNDTPVTTADLIDAIVYDTDDSDDAGLLVLLNAGQTQVNERGGWRWNRSLEPTLCQRLWRCTQHRHLHTGCAHPWCGQRLYSNPDHKCHHQ